VASAFDKALSGFQAGRNQRDILAQEAARSQIMGSLDPTTGLASPEQIQAMMEVDPELATHLYDTALQARLNEAKQDTWEQIPTPEGENGQWFRNPRTGETKKVGGGSPGEGGWKPSDLGSLRDDFTKAATSYDQSSPTWQSMQDSWKIVKDLGVGDKSELAGGADYNMVIGLAKLLDPNSVVREGEVESVRKTGGAADYLLSYVTNLAGGGSLTPEQRRGLMNTAYSRIKSYHDQARQKRDWIVGIAQRHNLNPDDIVPPLAELAPWAADEDDTEPATVSD